MNSGNLMEKQRNYVKPEHLGLANGHEICSDSVKQKMSLTRWSNLISLNLTV